MMLKRLSLLFLPFLLFSEDRVPIEYPISCTDLKNLVQAQIENATRQVDNETIDLVDYVHNVRNEADYLSDLADSLGDSSLQEIIWTSVGLLNTTADAIDSSVNRLLSANSDIQYYNDALLYDCDCGGGSSDGGGSGGGTNGCPCEAQLNAIRNAIIALQNDCNEYFIEGRAHFNRCEFFFGLATNWFNRVEYRLTIPDDGLYGDLANLVDDWKDNIAGYITGGDKDFSKWVGNAIYSDVGYDFTNEGVVSLFGLAAQWNGALAAVDCADTLHYIASNLNASAELSFFSNYLATTQSRFFQAFNAQFNPVLGSGFLGTSFTAYTNFWQNPSQPNFGKLVAVGNGKMTNWFTRIEFALYGLAGMFDSKRNDLGLDDNISSETSANDYLGKFTNSFNVSSLASHSNTVSGFIDRFKSSLSGFVLPDSSSSDTGITVIPSFSLGGIEFQSVILSFADLRGVTDFIRSMFTVIWYAIFAVVGWRVIVRMIALLITTIAHVIVVVKSLL